MTRVIYDQQDVKLQQFAETYNWQYQADADFEMLWLDGQLSLRYLPEPKMGAISVDFVDGATAHRRKFGGGRGQAIAKAVGLKGGDNPSVLDATAGLGRDAFVLATLGCQVQMHERNPYVASLLADGLERASLAHDELRGIEQRLSMRHGSSLDDMLGADEVDVVYLDPMYPHKQKSALVKKEMRVFQQLVGADLDADGLLEQALTIAKKRVVVKRPDYAEPLANVKPTMVIATKKNRFDVYVKAAM
ncbi:class I SAM-dependent methyltransferase [Paraferrimonas sp. SM1919]|uniref:class I SAM-dependent methyltransferase n=1 Tax=Paraferrimonas sp. SM1919 TaxID=2662263 RepID=UPI0013D08291|nr:class I SAM-dependent methyltransferase [Paraferrimonas sp. SM1919]